MYCFISKSIEKAILAIECCFLIASQCLSFFYLLIHATFRAIYDRLAKPSNNAGFILPTITKHLRSTSPFFFSCENSLHQPLYQRRKIQITSLIQKNRIRFFEFQLFHRQASICNKKFANEDNLAAKANLYTHPKKQIVWYPLKRKKKPHLLLT